MGRCGNGILGFGGLWGAGVAAAAAAAVVTIRRLQS